MSIKDRVRVEETKILSDNWYILKKATFSYRRKDGTWQRQSREVYDRGHGATILLYDPARRTVILTRQFRFPMFHDGYEDLLIEAPSSRRPYAARVASKTRFTSLVNRPSLPSGWTKYELITGESVIATTPDRTTAAASVIANSKNNDPVNPP